MNYSKRVFIKSPRMALEGEDVSGAVVLRVRWHAKKREVQFVVGVWGNPSKWDDNIQLPKQGTTHIHNGQRYRSADIRQRITKCIDGVDECMRRFELKGVIPTEEELKMEYYSVLGLSPVEIIKKRKRSKANITEEEEQLLSEGFFGALDNYMKQQLLAGYWSSETKKKYVTIKNILLRFDNNLSFDSLDVKKMMEFQSFLIMEGYHNSTIKEYCKRLKEFLKHYKVGKHRLFNDEEVLQYECKLKVPKTQVKDFLTRDEFLKIWNAPIPKERTSWEKARDVFVFMVGTGLRYSDASRLKRSNVVDNKIINVVMEKTDESVEIPLNVISRSVLNKYEDFPFKGDMALPVMSNQKLNKYLKELAEYVGIDSVQKVSYKCGSQRHDREVKKCERISSHWARRTFVSLGVASGATPTEIRSITGHQSENAMLPYLGVTDKQRVHATAVLDEMVTATKHQNLEKEEILEKLSKMSRKQLNRVLEFVDGEEA